jgi:hypothetical protein
MGGQAAQKIQKFRRGRKERIKRTGEKTYQAVSPEQKSTQCLGDSYAEDDGVDEAPVHAARQGLCITWRGYSSNRRGDKDGRDRRDEKSNGNAALSKGRGT